MLRLGVFVATVLRMLLTIGRTGKNGSLRLTENTDRIAFINGDENPLIDDWIPFGVEKYEICRAETAACQNDRGGVGNRGIGNFRVADDNLADRTVETEDAGVIHRDAQYVFLGKTGLERPSQNDRQADHNFRQFSG